ncbi:hypothetical protein [Paenibacillus zanthoxyli]|uniref:hypothetical protein n=1 Tax=Paenibacillus zanthoxyli TaxID=369399 RepID=UPI000471C478|nr:hypothetical protein [Paenibacillus zanthoxyli]
MGYYLTPEDIETGKANGIHAEMLRRRVYVDGWDVDRAVTEVPRQQQDRSEWRAVADSNGIRPDTFYNRLSDGWTEEAAATTPPIPLAERLSAIREKRRKYPQEWIDKAAANGISARLFRARVKQYGWSYERAALTPKIPPTISCRTGARILKERAARR